MPRRSLMEKPLAGPVPFCGIFSRTFRSPSRRLLGISAGVPITVRGSASSLCPLASSSFGRFVGCHIIFLRLNYSPPKVEPDDDERGMEEPGNREALPVDDSE